MAAGKVIAGAIARLYTCVWVQLLTNGMTIVWSVIW